MKRNTIGLLIIAGILLTMASTITYAQSKRNKSYAGKYLDKQFWIGLKAGGNLCKAKPVERFSTYSPTTSDDAASYHKQYKNFKKPGSIVGLEFTYYFKGLSVSLQPNFQTLHFSYTNAYEWIDPDSINNKLELNYTQNQKLSYAELPLLIRYEPMPTKVRPFVQAGIYYARLNYAYKQTIIQVTDYAMGGTNQYEADNITAEATPLFIRSYWGIVAGLGVSYPIGNIRISAEANYRYGFNNITSNANRFSNEQLSGAGDVLDNVKLRNLSMQFSILFPLRFLSTNYLTKNIQTEKRNLVFASF
ncbi:MAG: PorT family protein [Cytophagaceae bacterium]|nr:PorT family protein [Cytophagaceae bacterium]MDW8455700.1 PorT family protein [Cytophagaceae bacterium]